jgi:hypothetical protein
MHSPKVGCSASTGTSAAPATLADYSGAPPARSMSSNLNWKAVAFSDSADVVVDMAPPAARA